MAKFGTMTQLLLKGIGEIYPRQTNDKQAATNQ
jgi:hypothetical protein